MVKPIGPAERGGARNLSHEVSHGLEAMLVFPCHGHGASKSSRSTAHSGERDRNPTTVCLLLGPLLKASTQTLLVGWGYHLLSVRGKWGSVSPCPTPPDNLVFSLPLQEREGTPGRLSPQAKF